MPQQPSTLPVWATNGGTTLTPSGGQQAAGFTVNTRPPARWINWLFNLIYQWTQYLQAPVGTGAGAGVAATGGSSSGPGLSGTGGAPNGAGVTGAGTGTGAGVTGTGGGTSGTGVAGTGGASNGIGVTGTGVGTGAGVQANAAAGTASPALQVVPGSSTISGERIGAQSTPTGAGLVGDRYVDSVGRVSSERVAGTPGTFRYIGAPGNRILKTTGTPYIPTTGCTAFLVTGVGGGGAGGGCPSTTGTQVAVGSGGGAGGVASLLVVAPFASQYDLAYGAAGTGVSAGAGNAGGDSTVTNHDGPTVILRAKGGGGGFASGTAAGFIAVGGSVPATGGVGDTAGAGQPGFVGIANESTNLVVSGNGGSSLYGTGGINGAAAATGNGAGGGGTSAPTSTGSASAGGNGSAGCFDIIEFF